MFKLIQELIVESKVLVVKEMRKWRLPYKRKLNEF